MAKVSVSKYVRNVGKSLGYAAIESMGDSANTIKSYIESIDEGYKKIYTTIGQKIENRDKRSFKEKIKSSSLYKSVDDGFKNLQEDIKTGNWFNKDRVDTVEDDLDSMLGSAADIGYIGGGFAGSSRSSSSNSTDSDNYDNYDNNSSISSSSISPESMISAAYQSQTMTKTGEFIVKGNKANTQILMSHLSDINTRVIGSIGTVYSEVKATNQFLNTNILKHIEDTHKYQEETHTYQENALKQLNTLASSIDDLVSIQKSLYKPEKKYGSSSFKKLSDYLSYTGSIDFEEYLKLVKSNIKDALNFGGILSMASMGIGGAKNEAKKVVANPIGSLLTFLGGLIFKNTKSAMEKFNTSLENLFPNFISKLNRNSSNPWISTIAKIFGLKSPDDSASINISNYEKGPVPFDGITRKTIIEVIPGYLARIESAITGNEERYFDNKTAKWVYSSKISKSFANERNDIIASANSKINDNMESLYKTARDNGGEKQEKALRKKIDNMIKIIYKDKGKFIGSIDKGWKYYGFDSPEEFGLVKNALSKETITKIAKENIEAREKLAERYKEIEQSPGLYATLFNDTFANPDDKEDRWNKSAKNPSNFKKNSGLLVNTVDSYGKNVFYYLREILNSINNNWRKGRGGRYTKPNPKGPKGGPGVSPSSREGSSTDSSESSSDDDDGSDLDWDYLKKKQEEEKKEKGETEKVDRDTVVSRFIKKIFGDKGEQVYNKILDVFNTPVNFVTKLIEKADNSLFNLMFGDGEYYDSEGNRVDSAFDYRIDKITVGINKMVEKVTGFFRDTIYKKYLQPFFEKYIKPITTEAGNIIRKGAGYVKDTASSIFSDIKKKFSRQAKNMENGGVSSADDFENEASGNDGINTSAYGRVATKRGLTMISPGEIIIPATFDKNKQNKMEKAERKDRDRIADMIALNAKGNIKEKNEENLSKLKEFFSNIVGDSYNHTSKILAGGLVGGGAGLLAGNPFLGVLAGTALSIINSSETLKTMLLGKEVANDDGTKSRKGGLIPKKIIDIFSKALPDMGKFGLVGGVAGLITGFGPIGGAAIGVTASILKNDEKFKNFLFGENGLFKKDWVKKVEKTISKAAPNIAIGTGLGLLAGPFGLLGNAVVGASVGLLTSTDKFKKFMFGDPDHPEKNSVMKIINKIIIIPGKEKIKEILDSFKEYTQKNVLDPLKNFWDPFKQAMKNTVNSIADGIKDAAKNMLENTIGLPVADFLQEKIFKPLGTFISTFVKNPLKLLGMAAGGIATLPFKALGGIGNKIRRGQIRKGKAYDMSAEERLNYRTEYADNKLINRFLFGNKKKGTYGLTGFIARRKIIPENIKNGLLGGLNNLRDARGHGGLFNIWKDRAYDQDVALSNMSNEELDTLLSGTSSLLNSEEDLQTQIGSVKDKMSANISELFNKRDSKGKNLYDKLGFDYANQVMNLAASGDMDALDRYISNGMTGIPKEERAAVKNSIIESLTNDDGTNNVRNIKMLRDSIAAKREDTTELEKKLSEAFGKNINDKKGLRDVYKSVQAELNSRRKGEFIEEEKTPEQETNENINNGFDTVKKSFDEVTNNLNSIKNTIVDSAKEICYTINPSLRPKNEPSKENPIINTVNNIRNTSENADHKYDVYDQTTGNFVPKDKNDSAYKENEQEREDIKEEEAKNKEDEKEKRSKLNDFIDILIGKKKDRDKSRTGVSGIIGKIMSLRNAWDKQKSDGILGKVFKIGKKVVGGALIVSFLGYASQFIKTAIWPKIQTLLFGSEKEDGTRSGGLLGGLKNLIVGKDGKSGVLGSILGWFGEKFNSIAKWYRDNGGLGGLLTGAIEKIIVGQGYAIENIVAPLASLLVQSLPSVITGLVKGVLSGLKSLLTGNSLSNKKLSANSGSSNLNISGIVNNIENSRSKTNNTLKSIMDNENSSKNGKKLSSNLASIEKINKSSTSSSSSINWAKELGISSGTYYNSKGEVVESNNTTKPGVLWTKRHTNEIITDEDGNIANDYYIWNTDESVASKIYKSTATGIRNGLAGWGKDALSTALSKVAVSPVGKKLSTKAITGTAQVGAKAVGAVTSAGWTAGNNMRNGIVNFIKNSAENVAVNGSKAASGNIFTNLFKKLFGFIVNSKIGQIIVSGFTKGAGTTALQNALNKCAEKLGKHCATKLVGKTAGKLASLLSNATPVGIALAVVDFLWGMSHAETILGVAKGGYDVNFGLRCICGLLNLLSNRFTLGLISPSFILDLFIDAILPYFGVDVSELTNARSTYNEVLNAWNKAHPEETYDNLEDFNKRSKAGFWTRLSTSVKNIFGAKDKEVEKVMSNAGITYTSSTINSSTNNANVGFGRHLYQHDPSIAGMKYGNSTIAKAGCAPVAATNAIRNITGHGDLSHAAAYAEANGMVSPNGGTSMNYFNSYFRDNGISTTNTKSGKDVIDAVKSGHQVIMYGQDGSNDNTPFGTTPHFITATGIDKKGNIIIEDPDLPNESNAYNPRKVTGSMKSSIIINNKNLVGKGSNETDSSSTQGTASTFFSALTNLGTSMMKKAYGGLYDAIYGDGSETDTSNTSLTSTTTNNRSGSGGTFGSSSTNNTSSVDYNLSNRSDNSINGKTNEEKIWNYLRSKGYSTAGTAGIMGNLRMESNYTPYIVEGSQLSALGYPATNGKTKLDRSKEITADIQSGKFSKDKFVNTYFGYGLPQFTYKTWKQQLYENTVEKGKEIDSIANQLDYLTSTFEKYCGGLNNRLKRSTNAEESALDVFRTYEMPNWKSVKQYTYDNERKQYAADVFNRLAVGKGRDDTGLAQKSIDQYRTNKNTTTTNNNSNAVDYTTFLNTIVQLLLKISTNTELLSKVLDILSNNFGIDIDKSDIDTASKKTRAEGKAALNELVRRTTGNNTNLSKLLNNQDTEYIISAMTSLAKE